MFAANVAAGIMWIERGLPVFPIAISWNETKGKTDKRPLTGLGGYKKATTDRAIFNQLVYDGMTQLKAGEVLACATVPGRGGYVVFDDDNDPDLRFLANELHLPPYTYRPKTGSGCEHCWLKKREDVHIGNISIWEKQGVDVRSDAGYVVCPGTVTPWGTWTDPDEPGWGTFAVVPEVIWKQMVGKGNGNTGSAGGWKRYDPAVHDQQLHPATKDILDWLTDDERGENKVDIATVTFRTRDDGEPYLELARPGKGSGISATVGFVGPGVLYVFSSNWPGLKSSTAYELHQLAGEHHDGDGHEEHGDDNEDHGGDAPVAVDALFTRDGLQVQTLAEVVKGKVTHGRGQDGRLWVYRDGVWQPDTEETIPAAVAAILGERYRRSHLTNTTDLLRYDQSAPRIAGDPVPEVVNVANGLFDWQTQELRPHDPEVLSTVQLPVAWQDAGDCPVVKEFLGQVLPKDCIEAADDSPGFIWELIGYILLSGNPLHLAVLLFGSGRNGKGTLLRLLLALIGEHNVSSVALHDLVSNRFRVATLFGKLANIAGDLDAKWLESTALFKAITGGDQVQAELKYGATWDFVPWAVPVFSANKAFGSPDSSEGYFSRWVVVPFPENFVGKEDRNLTAKLTTENELTGVLHKALTALPVLMDRGRLPEPESVKEAKHEFIVASDPVRAWLADRAELDGSTFTIRTVLAKDYKNWCEVNDARSMSATELYSRLDTVSAITRKTINGSRGYRGIALKEGFA